MDLNENPFIKPTYFIDSENSLIHKYLDDLLEHTTKDPQKEAVAIYLAVRDDIYYDPFNIRTSPESLRASEVYKAGRGHCIDKSLLYVALCRAKGIPARLGLAKVRNHMGTSRLEEIFHLRVTALDSPFLFLACAAPGSRTPLRSLSPDGCSLLQPPALRRRARREPRQDHGHVNITAPPNFAPAILLDELSLLIRL